MNTTLLFGDLENQDHALFCVTTHISGWVRAIGEISVSNSTYSRSEIITIILKILQCYPVTFKLKVSAFLRDLPHLRLGSCYRIDLGIYFHIFKVKDHNCDIINTAMLSGDLQTQGHELFCVTFHISVYICAIGKISVSISTYSRSRNTIIVI